ncbi:MAG: hypothetical protein AB1499_07975 [Nitrospirota bacterium]
MAMIADCIKEGFTIANKNAQLVIISAVVSIINLVSFFVILGLPVIAALLYLGFDLAHAREMVPSILADPSGFVANYLGVIFLILTSFALYLSFTSVLYVYALGGTLGILKDSATNVYFKFSMASFFGEAKLYMSRLLGLISLVMLGVIVLFIIFMITGGIAAGVINAVTKSRGMLEMFFSSFALLSIIIFSILLVFAGLVFGVYSVVVLITDGKGVIESVGRTYNFLKQTPEALLFYLILIVGFVIANAFFYGIQVAVSVIPLFMPLVYIINTVFQSYLAIAVWSFLIVYYVKKTNHHAHHAGYEI